MAETGAMRQVVMTQGLMTIEGVSERFAQGFGRHLRLTVDRLSLIGGFASRDGRIEDATHMLGRAALVGDSLHRAGIVGEAGEIILTVRPLAAGEDGRILLVLGFDEAEGFRAELLMPAIPFETLKREILSGAAQIVTLSAMTSLWVRESDRGAGPDLPVAWHLGWDADGRQSAPARGLVETLEWRPAPASPAAGPADDEEPPDAAADQLVAINWSLKQIVLALVFLLIVVALK